MCPPHCEESLKKTLESDITAGSAVALPHPEQFAGTSPARLLFNETQSAGGYKRDLMQSYNIMARELSENLAATLGPSLTDWCTDLRTGEVLGLQGP